MNEQIYQGLELWPESRQARQLFILLHGVGAQSSDLVPLAERLKAEFPEAGFFLPDGLLPWDGGGNGRQWYSNRNINEENRAARVAEALPALHKLVAYAQQRFNVLQPDTALVGFSQGAIMALEFCALHDGNVGRVLAFAGRYAKLPEKAPELITLHMLHGEDDRVIPVEHAYKAYERLQELQGDTTLDVEPGIGHELQTALINRAIHRLKTTIPMRSWKQALNSAS
jgi:phospholipase/carboxylesterase